MIARSRRSAISITSWRLARDIVRVVGFCRVGWTITALAPVLAAARSSASGDSPSSPMATPCRLQERYSAAALIPRNVAASQSTVSPGKDKAAPRIRQGDALLATSALDKGRPDPARRRAAAAATWRPPVLTRSRPSGRRVPRAAASMSVWERSSSPRRRRFPGRSRRRGACCAPSRPGRRQRVGPKTASPPRGTVRRSRGRHGRQSGPGAPPRHRRGSPCRRRRPACRRGPGEAGDERPGLVCRRRRPAPAPRRCAHKRAEAPMRSPGAMSREPIS